jgi:hypothetical protein
MASSRQWLVRLTALVVMLTIAGAVSFVRYARQHRLNPQLFAVAPFDIFVDGLEPWRVRLAEQVTVQLGACRRCARFHKRSSASAGVGNRVPRSPRSISRGARAPGSRCTVAWTQSPGVAIRCGSK